MSEKFVDWYRPGNLELAGMSYYELMITLPSWLVVLGIKATSTAKVISWHLMTHMFPGFLTPVLTQLSFQSHRLLFSDA